MVPDRETHAQRYDLYNIFLCGIDIVLVGGAADDQFGFSVKLTSDTLVATCPDEYASLGTYMSHVLRLVLIFWVRSRCYVYIWYRR